MAQEGKCGSGWWSIWTNTAQSTILGSGFVVGGWQARHIEQYIRSNAASNAVELIVRRALRKFLLGGKFGGYIPGGQPRRKGSSHEQR
jgi:hypothetical protein